MGRSPIGTLVARGDRTGVLLAVVPANAELDLKALAHLSGDRKVEVVLGSKFTPKKAVVTPRRFLRELREKARVSGAGPEVELVRKARPNLSVEGPILQGLNKPVVDLSRGASINDIVNTVMFTSIMSQAT
jgi:hypothetical protein